MNNYKKVLEKRIVLLSVLVLLAAGFCVFSVFYADFTALKNSDVFGFQLGVMTAIGILAAVNIIRCRSVLKDEAKLRLSCNKENDERNRAIKSKAGMPILTVTSVAMVIAGVIAGYFNITVFCTLIIASICQMTVSAAVKLINMRRM
jgi:formate hydrogenlyase subunit 3/multisubunit Na+/H+ antiporter MnhD subunit